MRRLVILWAVTALFASVLPAGGAIATPAPDPDVIAGSYIVVLRAGDPGEVAAEHRRAHNAEVTHVYRDALRGYAARMSEQAAARVANDPRVDYVDADRVVTTAHHQCGHDQPVPGSCDETPALGTGTISGTVIDNSATTVEPIGGATVAVDGTTLSTTTDADGNYIIADVPEGDHTATATADGFDSKQEPATVVADQTTDVDFALAPTSAETRQPVPWGVERVGAPLANTGEGIHVYVLDTGIDPDHRDLGANVSAEGYAVETCKGGSCATDWDDDHGHGTHVAGTIGALDNAVDVVGVAPKVTLHAVKVLAKNGSGTRSGVIAGIDWVAKHNPGVARVANMSLGGSGSKTGECTEANGFVGSDSYHAAICNATHKGVVFAVAAGNSGADAESAVPAAYDDTVVTVSATTDSSDWPSWSNWGDGALDGIPTASAPVGIAAPGVSILSTQAGGGTTTKSGTSMAAPHVAGAMALFLKAVPQDADYTAFSDTRADLLGGRAQVTWDGSTVKYINGWKNTSGKHHIERFLQVAGL